MSLTSAYFSLRNRSLRLGKNLNFNPLEINTIKYTETIKIHQRKKNREENLEERLFEEDGLENVDILIFTIDKE